MDSFVPCLVAHLGTFLTLKAFSLLELGAQLAGLEFGLITHLPPYKWAMILGVWTMWELHGCTLISQYTSLELDAAFSFDSNSFSNVLCSRKWSNGLENHSVLVLQQVMDLLHLQP